MSINKHNSVPDEHEKQEVKNPFDRFIKRVALPTSTIGVLLIILFVVFVPKKDVKDMESIETGYETGGSPELAKNNSDEDSLVKKPAVAETENTQDPSSLDSQDNSRQNAQATPSAQTRLNALEPSYAQLEESIVALNDSSSQNSEQSRQEVVDAWQQFDEVYQNLKRLPSSAN